MNWIKTWMREIIVAGTLLLLMCASGAWTHWARRAPAPAPMVKLKPDCGERHRHWTSNENGHQGVRVHLTDCVDTE